MRPRTWALNRVLIGRNPYVAVRALADHSDLHTGWRPTARVQHLCTGGADRQVPPSITRAAATAWGIEAIVIDGLDHTPGIATCLTLALSNLTAQALPAVPNSDEGFPSSPAVVEIDLTPPLLSWSRIDVATLFLLAVVGVWTVVAFTSQQKRRNRIQCATVEPGGGRRRSCSLRFLSALLSRPVLCALLGIAAIATPTGFQLYVSAQSMLEGGELFDLEITSLRAVTGTLTDRQDAYALLSLANTLRVSALSNSPPPPSPSPPPPGLQRRTRQLLRDSSQRPGSDFFLDRSPTAASSLTLGNTNARRMQQTRTISVFYSIRGGRTHEAVVGNVLTPSALEEIRRQGVRARARGR